MQRKGPNVNGIANTERFPIDGVRYQVLSVEQLSLMLHKSVPSIRSDASRNPQALPPICRLPGNKRLLWRLEDVQAWLAKFVEPAPGLDFAHVIDVCVAKKRGRPRKTETGSRV